MKTEEKIIKAFEEHNNQLDESFSNFVVGCRISGKSVYDRDEFEKLDHNFVKFQSYKEVGDTAELDIRIGRWDMSFYKLIINKEGIFVKSRNRDSEYVETVIHDILYPIFHEEKFKYQDNYVDILLKERDYIMRQQENVEKAPHIIRNPLAEANYIMDIVYRDYWRLAIKDK